jgi:hypothetical protein
MALDQAKIGLKVISYADVDTGREESRSKFQIPADAQARRQQRICFVPSHRHQTGSPRVNKINLRACESFAETAARAGTRAIDVNAASPCGA